MSSPRLETDLQKYRMLVKLIPIKVTTECYTLIAKLDADSKADNKYKQLKAAIVKA